MAQAEKKLVARVGPVLKTYAKSALRYPGLLSVVVFSGITIEAAGVIAPLYMRQFINMIAGSTPATIVVSSLFSILALLALVNLVGWFGQRLRALSVVRLEAKVMVDLYTSAFAYLVGHAHDFFISHFTGTLTRRVTRYARSFEQVFDNVVFNFFSAFLFATGVIGVLLVHNVMLGVGLLVWTVLFVYVQFRMMQALQGLRAVSTAEDSKVTGFLSDTMLNHSTITAFAAAPFENARFKDTIASWYAATKRVWDADSWVYAVQGLFAVVIEIALLVGAVLLWQRGLLTVGDFVLIQVYIIGLMERLWGVGQNMRQLYNSFADATEMLDILELPHAVIDVSQATVLQVNRAEIVFDHVLFEYRDSQVVLRDFNLAIASHEKVALIGSSGAGKTTITKLLLRLYEVTSGTITIDGQDISRVTQESLRKAIAFVPQDPLLFHRTLRENIRYGRQDATDDEVVEAARQAHCTEFINRYEDGFDTMVGERGVKLSGGERQRVAIARAILKNAPILVLDEATSSLDSESERLIQDALLSLMRGKTVIAIAHRLSTVMNMDRLIVMENGSVVLSGTHDELLAQESNLYKKLWEIQAGGFIRDT